MLEMGVQTQSETVGVSPWVLRNAVAQMVDEGRIEEGREERIGGETNPTPLVFGHGVIGIVVVEGKTQVDGLAQPQIDTGESDELVGIAPG